MSSFVRGTESFTSHIMPSDAFFRIKGLCFNEENREQELISQLELILRTNQEVSSEQDDSDGCVLLHYAVIGRTVEFVKLLVESDGRSLSARSAIPPAIGLLPIHVACSRGNVEVVKYLHLIYPESINITDDEGYYPLHYIIAYESDGADLIRFLLLHDQGAV